jgi:hypothetical protein
MSRAVSPRPRHIAAVLAAVALAVPLGACGRERTTTFGATEGTYLDVGPLAYQVQISRALNPQDSEDRNYMQGVQAALATDETWFAIFMRGQNTSKHTQPAADDFEITDTLGNRFRPVAISKTNPFAYRPRPVDPGQVIPSESSAAGSGIVQQGAMLLFKIKLSSLSNRPLELHIKSPGVPQKEGSVELDV